MAEIARLVFRLRQDLSDEALTHAQIRPRRYAVWADRDSMRQCDEVRVAVYNKRFLSETGATFRHLLA